MFLIQILKALNRMLAERRAINALRGFDDRQLADIGLSRGEIPGAVHEGLSR